jgi:hypothetical protein
MEEQLHEINSDSLRKPHIKNLLYELDYAIDQAADKRDEQLAENTDLRRALTIVETFLRRKGRVCYGGMAINAHLPANLKFYDFSKTLPDYDFFSPEPEKDAEELKRMMEQSRFDSVSVRFGMHKGTYKVFVNYHSVADITDMPLWIYKRVSGRAIVEDGIKYCDEDFLRMNMYLELSRPLGEVERWDKVYRRLLMLNIAKPIQINSCTESQARTVVSPGVSAALIDYAIENKLTYYGAELKRIYEGGKKKPSGAFLKSSKMPMVVMAENAGFHAPILRQVIYEETKNSSLKIVHWAAQGDRIPELYGIRMNGRIVCLLINQENCNAINYVSIPPKQELRIASLDAAIYMWYTLAMVNGLFGIAPDSSFCFAKQLVAVSMKTRDKGSPGPFPLFPIKCKGHQPTKESLLKAKAERIRAAKTRKGSSSARRRGKTFKKR